MLYVTRLAHYSIAYAESHLCPLENSIDAALIRFLVKQNFLQRIAAVDEQSPIWGQSRCDTLTGAFG